MKRLCEFRETNNESVPSKAELTVMAYALSAEEQKEALGELRALSMHITAIEADVVNARITANYTEVVAVMNELEKKGWIWE